MGAVPARGALVRPGIEAAGEETVDREGQAWARSGVREALVGPGLEAAGKGNRRP